jgi:hypothetical protein
MHILHPFSVVKQLWNTHYKFITNKLQIVNNSMHDDIIDRVEIVLTLKKLLLLCQQTIETNCNWHGRSSFNLKETNCYSVNKK